MDDAEMLQVRGIAFRITANDLQSLLNKLVKTDVTRRNNEMKLVGYTLSITILRGLSAEFMLKAISKIQSGTFERTHDLYELYEALNEDTKRLIVKTASSHGVANPETVLKSHKDDFVRWRYSFGGESTNFLDLDKTLEILHTVYGLLLNRGET